MPQTKLCGRINPRKCRTMTEILYKSKHAIVIYKPQGVPSQPDPSGDPDALTITSRILSELGEPTALYPVHRLDRTVAGVLVIARTASAAAELSLLVSGEGMGKEYFAVVEGEGSAGLLEDHLIKNSTIGKASVASPDARGARLARLEYKTLACVKTEQGARSLIAVKLHTGRFHQIRAQLSSRGMPIVGDKKYGSRDYLCRTPALFSYKLDISVKGERITASRLPELASYPWCLFPEELYSAQ